MCQTGWDICRYRLKIIDFFVKFFSEGGEKVVKWRGLSKDRGLWIVDGRRGGPRDMGNLSQILNVGFHPAVDELYYDPAFEKP